MFDNKEEYQRNKAIIALMIKMAKADYNIDPIEKRFIYDVADRLNLTQEDVIDVINNLEDHILKPPADEGERMKILYYLLFMMRIDGEIPVEEEQLCYKASLRLGFNEQLTAEMIDLMKKYLKEELPPEAMVKVIRKYLN